MITIRALPAPEAAQHLDALAAMLVDAVAHGASVNFMAGMGIGEARAFWQAQLAGLEQGSKQLFVAEPEGSMVGTVVLTLAGQPNAPHRAEIGKMLVHSSARRQGLGRSLLATAEAAALAEGRTLLLLDTQEGSAGEALYRSCGWRALGTIPAHAYGPEGTLHGSVLFCKELGSHRAPPSAQPSPMEPADTPPAGQA